MAHQDPVLLRPGEAPPPGAGTSTRWFERKVGEFTLQTRLPCHVDRATGHLYVRSEDWVAWSDEMVRYFIENGFRGPEIDAFIRKHTLGTG